MLNNQNTATQNNNLFATIGNWIVAPHKGITDEIQQRKASLLAGLLAATTIFGTLIIALVGWFDPNDLDAPEVVASMIVAGICLGLYIGTKLGFYKWIMPIYLLIVVTLFLVTPYNFAPSMLPFIMIPILIANIYYSPRIAVPFTVFLVILVYILNETAGMARNEIDSGVIYAFRIYWYLIILAGALSVVFAQHMNNLARVRESKLEEANQLLRQSELLLEQRVQDRTRDLKLSSEVAKQVTTVLDLEKLLPRFVEQMREGFNLYAVAVFLYHEAEQKVVLQAGSTAQEGMYTFAADVSFDLEARPSLVAKAARTKEPVIINDVTEEESFAREKILPDTQSECVLPLLIGESLIGVLSMQCTTKGRFTPADVEIYTTLAEQIAIAVNNAKLYAKQRQLTQELRQADIVKNQFLASMSHELRTPLNGIMNFTEMVSSGMMGEVNEDQKELLDQSLDSSKHLLGLINDVLDITKIQAGKLTLFVEDNVNLHNELGSVITLVKPMIAERSVKLIEDIDDNLPNIRGDKRRLRQILLNLTSNAVKFTHEGTITISAKHKTDHILLAVIDTGMGVSAEMQETIFEPFIQTVDGVKHAEGTGLGLPITKSLVEAHNGRIWLESEVGLGSAFYVILPTQITKTNQSL